MKKILVSVISAFTVFFTVNAQVDIEYQLPPKEILELADAKTTPSIRINDEGDLIVLMYRSRYSSIEELSQPELRIAGLRINPVANIRSRTRYYNNITLMNVGSKEEIQVKGLPEKPRLSNFSWSPDQSKMSFTNTTGQGVELWILDFESQLCKKITGPVLNANMGNPSTWFKDSEHLLVQFIPDERKDLIDKSKNIPTGPLVSVSTGVKAQNRTYQDLLKDNTDEFNFEQLALSKLYKVSVSGEKSEWKETAMFNDISFSPDGNYIMLSTISKPFSYIVTYRSFPRKTSMYDKDGNFIKTIQELPLIEDAPTDRDAVLEGMRRISWRADKPATLYWVEAIDGGDPKKETDFRDEVFELDAPFNGKPGSLLKTIQRFSGITWGDDEIAIAYDRWWNTRNTKTYIFNPGDPTKKPEILFDRNYQDRYNDPGSFITKENEFGRDVLQIEKNKLFLIGDGFSDEGVRPFIDEFKIKTRETKRLWQADGISTYEAVSQILDIKKGDVITRIESPADYPNYFLRNIKSKKEPEPITFFENPFKSLLGVHKELIKYKRDDGIELSGILYVPPGYNMQKKEKLPMVMWAYPREFKDASSAGQVTTSEFRFTSPSYGSPVFWVMRGYAVLDGAAFPIVGVGDEEPNNSFVKQLVANAKAAIDAVDELGYIDREKVAVGGHSYGAFMTANLLSHCDLFAAGIARSGAYNRTLTPFGFQNEQRTYWEAPEIYYQMSPFMHADKMNEPLLLIHGQLDNNSGTFPIQSERYFNALKGHGANVRLVFLPKESHGYSARESVLHVLWEQDQWLEKWVKNMPASPADRE